MPTRGMTTPLALAMGLCCLALMACGQDADAPGDAMPWEEAFQKVTSSDRIFTFDDLVRAGFKKSKEYDVEGLIGATEAWFGWWSLGGALPFDYEVRFYRSHPDAVEHGTPFAEEASGKEAIINSDDATWKEGVRDRRVVIGATGTVSNGVGPKYGDFVIFGNVVMLCEGMDSEQSLGKCASLARALEASGGE